MVATKVGWHVLVKAEAATGGARRAAFTRTCHPTTIGHRGRRLACIYRRTEGSTRIVDLRTRSLSAIYWQVYAAGNHGDSVLGESDGNTRKTSPAWSGYRKKSLPNIFQVWTLL